jgi:hypothetical protein
MLQQQIFDHIFNDSLVGGHSKAYTAASEFPYFNAAHYFALATSSKNARDYAQLASNASLFFNQPLYLQYILAQKDDVSVNADFIADNFEMDSVLLTNTAIEKEEAALSEKEIDETPFENTVTSELKSEGNIAAATAEPDNKKSETATEENALPLFEPLFARDYFASQGIKLSEAMLGDDKLGQQLKSFTSWLKSMKKLHPEKLVGNLVVNEQAIQEQAAKSNLEIEVLTEAMADVFAQQGKIVRAQEIYEKLSLQNPLKSAYFAAKIEKLG